MAGSRQDSIDRHVARWRDELDYLDPVHEAIVARLMILSRHLAGTRDAAHADAALPRPSFKILLALRRLGTPYTASPSALADAPRPQPGRPVRAARPARGRAGWSPGRVDKDDRRRVHVRLTAAGRRAFDRHARLEGRDEAALLGRPLPRRPAAPGRPAARAGARRPRPS